MKVSIVGLGRFGEPLARQLLEAGHQIFGTTRTSQKQASLNEIGITTSLLTSPQLPIPELLNTDVLILNIPPQGGQLQWFQEWSFEKLPWVIFISSTSGKELLLQEESWVKSNFKEWTILRFAGLVGPQLHPGNFLSGKKNIKGRLWPVNLLHLEDAVGFTRAIMDKSIKQEVLEVCCDEHHTKEEFYSEYAQRLELPLPEFEVADETKRPAIDNQRARQIYDFRWSTMIGKYL